MDEENVFGEIGFGDIDDGVTVEGPRELDQFFRNVDMVAKSHGQDPSKVFGQIGKLRIAPHAQLHPDLKATLGRVARISRAIADFSGRIQADYLRRANQVCGIFTTALAPSATVAFTLSPSNGQAWYRILGLAADDLSCARFGFTSLKIGGMEHVNFNQSTPAAPVTNAVPWTGFQVRESSHVFNLQPWTGQDFDNNTNVTGTIANMTVAATADAATAAAKMQVSIFTDPCGQNYAASKGAALASASNMRRVLGHYIPPGRR
jgi:hypothetical protein